MIIAHGHSGIDAHVTPDADPDRAQEYREISSADPFVGLPEGQVVAFRDFVHHVPPRFRAWLNMARLGNVLGVDLHREPDTSVRLRLTRDQHCADFDDAEHDPPGPADPAFAHRAGPACADHHDTGRKPVVQQRDGGAGGGDADPRPRRPDHAAQCRCRADAGARRDHCRTRRPAGSAPARRRSRDRPRAGIAAAAR